MMAQRITMLRKQQQITQAELARRLNISPSALGNYEQGRRLPDIDTLVEMAKIFGVSLDYLVTGKETMSKRHAYVLRCCCGTDDNAIDGHLAVPACKMLLKQLRDHITQTVTQVDPCVGESNFCE